MRYFIIIFIALLVLFILILKQKKRSKFSIVHTGNSMNVNKGKPLNQHVRKELIRLAVDQDHYLFLVALTEGRVTDQEYDRWAHSRKHEGQEVFRQLLRRPYKTRKL
ncbi:hypothetical protein [Bacillus sp. FJAT-45037]|uniref:hypothetical protein n=1 Tax=Bacillus sp. FJAT-45037 TaxID=2011007 RepID=UPI000C249524|nr:hypothetical protein [Bacillus sp. FJAT-45037]